MSPKSKLNHSGALEGVHGVHVDPHSPFLLTETNENGEFNSSTCGTSTLGTNHLLAMQRVWQQRPACLRPIKCSIHGNSDKHAAETVANVLTSIPFIALGMNAPRKNFNSKLYANSLIGVGVASSIYHCSRGRLRKFLRWVDYTMIATTTVCLSRALRNENPKLLMAATAVFLPVQPLMVSVVHTGMMEVAFAKRALKDPDLRTAHTVHKMSSLLGGMLFIADDLFPKTPYLHAAWHLAAAIGVGTCNKLLE
ncbi:fold protein [Senna tora]|uniref:Fold protein n=1 Tax=Senna tora TaxID=362788 RepID=A0A834TSM2_9FABA|nr:fold protein [Senna tora]